MRLVLILTLLVQTYAFAQQDSTVVDTVLTSDSLDIQSSNDSVRLFIKPFGEDKVYFESVKIFGGKIVGYNGSEKTVYKDKYVSSYMDIKESSYMKNDNMYLKYRVQRSIRIKKNTLYVSGEDVLDNGVDWMTVIFSDGEKTLVLAGGEHSRYFIIHATDIGGYEGDALHFGNYSKFKEALKAEFGHVEGFNETVDKAYPYDITIEMSDLFIKKYFMEL